MIKVSLIIPVYNAEKFLSDTLECVQKQSLKEIEVLLIDDGSRDKSGEICDEFAKRDSRFRVFHQENSGMCAARNFAMSIAKGEYISFADNDDLFLKDFLKDNYELAKQYDADVVKFSRKGIYINDNNETIGETTRLLENRVLDKQTVLKEYFELSIKGILSAVWDGIYRRQMIEDNKLKFHEQFRYGSEDTLFNREMVFHINKLVLNDQCYYFHLIRSSYSASAKFNDKALDKYKQACALEYKIWQQLGINNLSDGKKEQGVAKEYLIPILFMLCDSNCKYSYRKKREYLEEIHNSTGFSFNITKEKYKNIFRLNKKRGIIIRLFDMKWYWIVLFIAARYKKLIHKRLTKGVVV